MKQMLLKAAAVVGIVLVFCVVFSCVCEYLDRRHCVCSILTGEEQTLPIDDRLYRVCEKDLLKSGTFRYTQISCDHGKSLLLTISPDEGNFRGRIVTD